ncbi:MAG: hypothetical protein K0S11_124 [Gammaproteobacteria bacterium]|jgi:hypothetical protein|nr:hypothetical protein [Gammaproteobacteria bacterium]
MPEKSLDENNSATKKWLNFNQEYLALNNTELNSATKAGLNTPNPSFDYISPAITGTTLIAGTLLGSHLHLGLSELPLKTGLTVFNAAKPVPAIMKTNLDDSQAHLNDYDPHARECLQIQKAVNLSSNLLSIPSAGLKIGGSLLPLAGVGGAAALTIAGAALSLGAGVLGIVAGGIGIYYYSYKINVACQHAEALQRWTKELAIYQKMLAEITKCQVEVATIKGNEQARIGLLGEEEVNQLQEGLLVKLKQEQLAQLKLTLTSLLAKVSNQEDYKNAWAQLVNNSTDTKQLLANVEEGILQTAGFIGGYQLPAKNQELLKLQEATQQEPQLKTLKEAVSQDPKLAEQRKTYKALQTLKNQKSDKFSQGLSNAKEQAKLDRDKKNLEIDENIFKLKITAMGLITSGLVLAVGGLTLAHTPPLAITVLGIAASLLTIGIAISIYKYSQTNRSLNEDLDTQQQKLMQKKAVLLNEPNQTRVADKLNKKYQTSEGFVAVETLSELPGLRPS